ncbi:unnamed protein product [Discosporangium mesarthrocarpum]
MGRGEGESTGHSGTGSEKDDNDSEEGGSDSGSESGTGSGSGSGSKTSKGDSLESEEEFSAEVAENAIASATRQSKVGGLTTSSSSAISSRAGGKGDCSKSSEEGSRESGTERAQGEGSSITEDISEGGSKQTLTTEEISGSLEERFKHRERKKAQEKKDGEPDSQSRGSSTRTIKSLPQQKEWEIDHARRRATRLRAKMVARFDREREIRAEMASIVSQDSSTVSTKPSVDEVMGMVGWDPEKDYSPTEMTTFANKALVKLKEFGVDGSRELAEYGTKKEGIPSFPLKKIGTAR